MDTVKSLIEKLSESLDQNNITWKHLQGVSSLSADDEFEVEYLVDSILKTSKKLSTIIKNYPSSSTDKGKEGHYVRDHNANANLVKPELEDSDIDCVDASHVRQSKSTDIQKVMHLHSDTESEASESELFASSLIESDHVNQNERKQTDLSDPDRGSETDGISELDNTFDYTSTKVSDNKEIDGEVSDVTVDYESDSEKSHGDAAMIDKSSSDNKDDLSILEKSEIEGCLEAFQNDDFDDDFDDDALDEIADVELNANEAVEEEEDIEDDAENVPQDKKYLNVLKKYFGFSKFRPLQWKIINAVLNDKRDNCVIMATGYGKSLCYQYPSVFTGRITAVISPLISLMEDQVLSLSAVNIPSCFLGSTQDNMAQVKSDLLRGKYRVVYLTPEFCEVAPDILKELDSSVGVDLVAIDEAHCVCQWGHDFRKSYRSLGKIRRILPKVPMMALTATATPAVRVDMCRSLGLKTPLMTCTGFDRVNLYLSVTMKRGDICGDLKSQMVKKNNKLQFEGSTIVYCPTKKATEEVHNALTGLKSAIYHAGLSKSVRRNVHKKFLNDELQVVVATVAFGMGIDKPDVRKVVHYGAPKDIESYYQEIGRAGRDGQPATCHVFYSQGDFTTIMFLLKDIPNQAHKEHKLKMVRNMKEYLSGRKCRRKAILSHFEDKAAKGVGMTESCCDNCRLVLEAQARGEDIIQTRQKDFGEAARDIFNVIELTNGSKGLGTYVKVLCGSEAKNVPKISDPLFGKYKSTATLSKMYLTAVGRQLITEHYLEEDQLTIGVGGGGFGGKGFCVTVVNLSKKGSEWLRVHKNTEKPKLMMLPNAEVEAASAAANRTAYKPVIVPTGDSKIILPMVPSSEWLSTSELKAKKGGNVTKVEQRSEKDNVLIGQLMKKLMVVRNNVADENQLHSVNIFTNKTLLDMAKYRPTSRDNLSKMDGVALQRVNLYGDKFIDIIKQFSAENNWTTDCMPEDDVITIKLDTHMEQAFMSLPDTAKITYNMFERDGKTLNQTATQRGFKTGTLCSHLASCIEVGLPVDLERLGVTKKIYDLIVKTIRAPPINSDISRLTPIKEQLPEYVSFDQIKLVLAVMKKTYGVTGTNLVASESEATSEVAKESLQQFARTSSTPKLPWQQSIKQMTAAKAHTINFDLPKCSNESPCSSNTTDSIVKGDSKKRALPQSLLRTNSQNKKQKTSEKLKKNSLFAR